MLVSIIIPVYKEVESINTTIENIYKSNKNNNFEIIVVDAEQDGRTINIINNINVKKIISEKGRSKQMNCGSSLAKGEILLFLHADTILPDQSIDKIIRVMENNQYIAGAFNLGINSTKLIFRIIEVLSSLRSKITRIPYGDQAIFINKDYFIKIGKFSQIPLMEEVELMLKIKKNQKKIFIINEKVKTSARRWQKEGIIYCTFRNWILINLYFLGIKPDKLVKFYK